MAHGLLQRHDAPCKCTVAFARHDWAVGAQSQASQALRSTPGGPTVPWGPQAQLQEQETR